MTSQYFLETTELLKIIVLMGIQSGFASLYQYINQLQIKKKNQLAT